MRKYWIFIAVVTFLLGMAVDRAYLRNRPAGNSSEGEDAALAGIEKLHRLDERVTLLHDAKALQQEWSNQAVRLMPDGPVDIGKEAIYKTDLQSLAMAPDAAIVNYKPDIRDVRVVGDWAFEWGLFEAGFRASPSAPVQQIQGKLLRVLHRESDGNWKFARVMAVWK